MINLDYKKLIKLPYYYVPPCPNCGSRATGRMIKANRQRSFEWVFVEALKNGELVAPASENFQKNLFCNACGHTWEGPVRQFWLTKEQIVYEKEIRGTDPLLQQKLNEIAEENKHKGLLKKMFGF